MDVDWDRCDNDMEDTGDDEEIIPEIPINRTSPMAMHCSLCSRDLPNTRALLTHVLSVGHNKRLTMESSCGPSSLLKRLKHDVLGRKTFRKEAVLTKQLKYLSPPKKMREIEEGEIVDESDEDSDDEAPASPKPKQVQKESKTVMPAAPVSKIDLRNKLNEMKEKQQEERKAEKRKKKNIRTREAKKRNKKLAKEDKKRIEDALEALEEEDEDVAFMKHTMGFSKFQTTKRSYF